MVVYCIRARAVSCIKVHVSSENYCLSLAGCIKHTPPMSLLFCHQHTNIDTPDEEDFALLLLADGEENGSLQKTEWVRHYFQMRPAMCEFHTTLKNLIDHPDEMMLFNYMRMLYNTYNDWVDITPHLPN